MKKLFLLSLCFILMLSVLPVSGLTSTEQEKQIAINKGLNWLASTQSIAGAEGYWPYNNSGTLAATAAAALAFIEEGYLPGADFIIDVGSGPVNYGDVVGRACNYIFNRLTPQSGFGWETAVYPRHGEDYNNDGILNDGGNSQALYFNPGDINRTVYTTGIATAVVYGLGNALGPDTVVGMGPVSGPMTYRQVLRDIADWVSFAQVEPDMGVYRGGWRYYANQTSSDNSTAQWGALPILYARDWGMVVPDYVKNELAFWVAYVQNVTPTPLSNWMFGGSGYSSPTTYVNMSKTGGLLLELAVLGAGSGDPRVVNAFIFMQSNTSFDHWNAPPSATWDGNLGHPYSMWAVYKGLEVYGLTEKHDNGSPGDTSDDFLVGKGINPLTGSIGGITIGQDWSPTTSAADDWYSQYCNYLVGSQNPDGSWSGYSYWYGPLATGWYINILNASGAPEPVDDIPFAEIDPELLEKYVAYSKEYLKVMKKVDILSGDIGSNDNLDFKYYNNLNNDIRALGNVSVMYQSTVEGNVVAGGTVSMTVDSAVNGTIDQGVAGLEPYSFSVDDFECGGENLYVSGDVLEVAPGKYGKLGASNGKVVLSSGVYFFSRVSLRKGSEIQFNIQNEPVVVNICEELLMYDSKARIISVDGCPNDILFNVKNEQGLYTVQINNSSFLGTIIAPNSEAWLTPEAHVTGAVYAGKKLIAANSSTMIFAPFGKQCIGPAPKLASSKGADSQVPEAISLSRNFPNPFNPSTTIQFIIPAGDSRHVILKAYDIRGGLIRTLVDEHVQPGMHSVVWDGTDELGRKVSSGIYVYKLDSGVFSKSYKMMLMK